MTKKPNVEPEPDHDPFADWVAPGVPHGSFCHCGTCRDALAAAIKTYEQMRANDCELWAAQVAAHLHALAGMGIVNHIALSNPQRGLKSKLNTAAAKMIVTEVADGCRQIMTEKPNMLLVANMFNKLNKQKVRG